MNYHILLIDCTLFLFSSGFIFIINKNCTFDDDGDDDDDDSAIFTSLIA